MIKVDLFNREGSNTEWLPTKMQITQWISSVCGEHNIQDAILSLALLSDTEIQSINQQFRNKNKPTNVLAFPFEKIPGVPSEHFLGDILICPLILTQEALAQNKKLEAHWCHIIIHAMLHLLNYDHMTSEQALVMESMELKLLKIFNIKDPYLLAD